MAVLAGAVLMFVPEQPSFLFQTSCFLVFTTVITYLYLQRATHADDFVRLYLAMVVLKLMMGLGYAVLIVTRDQDDAKANVLYFLVVYLVLTAIEVTFLYRQRNR